MSVKAPVGSTLVDVAKVIKLVIYCEVGGKHSNDLYTRIYPLYTHCKDRWVILIVGNPYNTYVTHYIPIIYIPIINGWWRFQTCFIFTPKIGEDEPILTSIFFQGVGSTTN